MNGINCIESKLAGLNPIGESIIRSYEVLAVEGIGDFSLGGMTVIENDREGNRVGGGVEMEVWVSVVVKDIVEAKSTGRAGCGADEGDVASQAVSFQLQDFESSMALKHVISVVGSSPGLAIPGIDAKASVGRGSDSDTLVLQAGEGVVQRGGVASGKPLQHFSEEAVIATDRIVCVDVMGWSV